MQSNSKLVAVIAVGSISMNKAAFVIVILTLALGQSSRAQQVHASLADQKVCAEQAKKFFNETDYSDNSKKPIKNEYTSHYDAAAKVCYVRIDFNIYDAKTKKLTASSYVFDAFEGRNFAEYVWFSDPVKKYWEVKPFSCSVKPMNGEKLFCNSTEEFEKMVDRYFGLGE
jgi:hypothetical protein